MCFSFEPLELTVLKYVRVAYLLQDKYIVLVTVLMYKEDYLVYNFYLQIGSNGQVTVLTYQEDYLVYKFIFK